MLKKSHDVKIRQRKLFIGLFLVSIFFSFINLFSFLNINIYPEYFVALMVLTVSSNLITISITKVFLVGVIVDILIGSILGQYTITFLLLYGLQIFSQKYFLMPTRPQAILLKFLSICLGIIIVTMISQSFNTTFSTNGSLLNYLIIEIAITFVVLIIFQIFYERTYGT
ncbi:rod shape-determining protein MreD [Methylophilaceae bacterium]|nr:rod shape-determining protein MreD [Methylophilaceae bacterium]